MYFVFNYFLVLVFFLAFLYLKNRQHFLLDLAAVAAAAAAADHLFLPSHFHLLFFACFFIYYNINPLYIGSLRIISSSQYFCYFFFYNDSVLPDILSSLSMMSMVFWSFKIKILCTKHLHSYTFHVGNFLNITVIERPKDTSIVIFKNTKKNNKNDKITLNGPIYNEYNDFDYCIYIFI